MNIKKALRKAMAERDIDQKDLAELSGISKTTISQTMTGKTSPNSATISKLAQGLGFSYSELIALGE